MVDRSVGGVPQCDRAFSEYVTGTTESDVNNGWQRLYVTFDAVAGTTYRVYGVICNTTGTAWFDCFQLEEGEAPNKFNLVLNPSFETVDGTAIPQLGNRGFHRGRRSVPDHWMGSKGVKMARGAGQAQIYPAIHQYGRYRRGCVLPERLG